MDEIAKPVEMIANYGILIVIAAVFLLVVVLVFRHWLTREKLRDEREDKRYEQIMQLTQTTAEIAARGNAALESSTEALRSVQKSTETVVRSTEAINRVMSDVCKELKDQGRYCQGLCAN